MIVQGCRDLLPSRMTCSICVCKSLVLGEEVVALMYPATGMFFTVGRRDFVLRADREDKATLMEADVITLLNVMGREYVFLTVSVHTI